MAYICQGGPSAPPPAGFKDAWQAGYALWSAALSENEAAKSTRPNAAMELQFKSKYASDKSTPMVVWRIAAHKLRSNEGLAYHPDADWPSFNIGCALLAVWEVGF